MWYTYKTYDIFNMYWYSMYVIQIHFSHILLGIDMLTVYTSKFQLSTCIVYRVQHRATKVPLKKSSAFHFALLSQIRKYKMKPFPRKAFSLWQRCNCVKCFRFAQIHLFLHTEWFADKPNQAWKNWKKKKNIRKKKRQKKSIRMPYGCGATTKHSSYKV